MVQIKSRLQEEFIFTGLSKPVQEGGNGCSMINQQAELVLFFNRELDGHVFREMEGAWHEEKD